VHRGVHCNLAPKIILELLLLHATRSRIAQKFGKALQRGTAVVAATQRRSGL
jgi:hypothetical protein